MWDIKLLGGGGKGKTEIPAKEAIAKIQKRGDFPGSLAMEKYELLKLGYRAMGTNIP